MNLFESALKSFESFWNELEQRLIPNNNNNFQTYRTVRVSLTVKNSESSFLFDFNTLFETHYIMNEWIVPMILHKHV